MTIFVLRVGSIYRFARTALLFIAGFAALSLYIAARPTGDGHHRTDASKTVLRVAVAADPIRLDPHDATDAPSTMINFHIYDRLVEIDQEMNVVPSLARAWQHNASGDEWTIFLRPGVIFHDGSRLTADAVKANFDRLLDPELALARSGVVAGVIRSVEAVDQLTLKFRLTGAVAPFLHLLAHDALGIAAPSSFGEGAVAGRTAPRFQPIGTGPFLLKEWVPGTRLVLDAFASHWRGAPRIDQLQFVTVPTGSARAIMVETGEVEVAVPIEPAHVQRLRTRGEAVVSVSPTQRLIYLALNLTQPPFDDAAFRRAVSAAIDRQAIVDGLLFGLATPTAHPLTKITRGYPEEAPDAGQPTRSLTAEAGPSAPASEVIDLWSPSGRYPQDRAVAQAIAATIERAGVPVRLSFLEWGTYLAGLHRSKEWEAAVLGWAPATGDADMALRPLLQSGQRGNIGGYDSPEVDALLDLALRQMDDSARRSLYREALAALERDMPIIPLYSTHIAVAHVPFVRGLEIHSTETVDFRFVWLEREQH